MKGSLSTTLVESADSGCFGRFGLWQIAVRLSSLIANLKTAWKMIPAIQRSIFHNFLVKTEFIPP